MTAVKSTVLIESVPHLTRYRTGVLLDWGYGRVADFVLGVHSEVVLASLSLRYHSYPVGLPRRTSFSRITKALLTLGWAAESPVTQN
ncbi:MAG: hypothetical protein HLUCCO16_04760 [Phormidium sp. OSCR]|nr:MAG: hypothetical protein HLUCCO16_04760 [Phormidium sp. OSCR]